MVASSWRLRSRESGPASGPPGGQIWVVPEGRSCSADIGLTESYPQHPEGATSCQSVREGTAGPQTRGAQTGRWGGEPGRSDSPKVRGFPYCAGGSNLDQLRPEI